MALFFVPIPLTLGTMFILTMAYCLEYIDEPDSLPGTIAVFSALAADVVRFLKKLVREGKKEREAEKRAAEQEIPH